MSNFWEKVSNWFNYDEKQEVFLVIVLGTSGTHLNKTDAKNVLWSYLNYHISFEDAYLLSQRESIPEQWQSKLLIYEGRWR